MTSFVDVCRFLYQFHQSFTHQRRESRREYISAPIKAARASQSAVMFSNVSIIAPGHLPATPKGKYTCQSKTSLFATSSKASGKYQMS